MEGSLQFKRPSAAVSNRDVPCAGNTGTFFFSFPRLSSISSFFHQKAAPLKSGPAQGNTLAGRPERALHSQGLGYHVTNLVNKSRRARAFPAASALRWAGDMRGDPNLSES